MLFDDPITDEKAKQALGDLAECCESNDELNLLVALIRMFYKVKREKIITHTEKNQSALHLVKS